ncbi:hypothetical protein LCGC14_1446150 [marine sediment metagenome]|uniref:Uncharacterized protein n=1 Tax=marine sediment metagenome TaxID=412755 RepID=A0A0F9JJ59_9ZZZZ
MSCTQCGAEIVAWSVHEIWSGEMRDLLNNDPRQLCNSCAWHCDGILEYADNDEMDKFSDTLPPLSDDDIATLKSMGMWIGQS